MSRSLQHPRSDVLSTALKGGGGFVGVVEFEARRNISLNAPILARHFVFVFGWGMGLLLIMLGMTGWMISSGKWMLTVKAVLGILLALMGAWVIIQGIRGQPLIPISLFGT